MQYSKNYSLFQPANGEEVEVELYVKLHVNISNYYGMSPKLWLVFNDEVKRHFNDAFSSCYLN